MSNLTTRAGKGSPLTNNELDANFTNLNADKVEIGGDLSGTPTAPIVTKVQGQSFSSAAANVGEKLVWNGTAWAPATDPSGEPIGHADKSESSIGFNSGTRTFTISPVSASFVVWCKGVKHTYTSAQTVVIPNTTGLHFIYFNASGVLSTQMTYFTWEEHAPTAYIYWNATTQQAVYFGDERHGITLDWQTHEYLHRTRGAAIANGFGASGYTTTGTGATDADAQIDIGGGTFFDEDMQVDIVSTNTPVAGTWQQDLSGPALIPVLYLSGSSWVLDSPTNFPFKVVSGVPQYNLYSGGTWSTAPVANNEYFVSWILATNNLTYPVIAIISQAPTNQLSGAEAMTFEGLSLNGFPSVEFRPLYKVIYQYKTGFTNSIKASTISVYDLRSLQSAGVAAALVQDHGNLSGLGDDDHAQYLHVSEVRTPSSAVKNSFLPSQTSNNGKYLTTDGINPSWGDVPSGSLTFTGDVTGTGNTGSSTTLTLANSGVTAGTFTKVTVDTKGRVTTGASANSSDIATALGFTPENVANKAVANGYASLDGSGKVPSNQLPSYVDDVLEYANLAAFPATGETGKIYIAIDTVKTYRWSGSAYVEITSSPGSTDAVPEGSTNLYFTNARARAAVGASGSLSYSTATGIFSYTQPTNVSAFTNDSGYLTGITGAQVTSALGYTPYNATNPSGYITGITSGMVTTALGYTPYNSSNPSGYITSSYNGFMLRGAAVQSDPNTNFVSSAYRFDPNANNPTNTYYAVLTYGNESNVVGQLATHFSDGTTYTRAYNSVWSAWRTQLDSSNYSSYALPLSGGTLSGDLGVGVSPSTRFHVSGAHTGGRGIVEFDSTDIALIALRAPTGSDKFWGIRAQDSAGADLMYYGMRQYGLIDGFVVEPLLNGDPSFFVKRSTGDVGVGISSGFNSISGTERTVYIANSNAASLYLHATSGSGRKYALFSGASGGLAIYDVTGNATRFLLTTSAADFSVALQQSGNQVLHAGNYGSGYFKTINGSSIIGTGDLTVSGTDNTKLPLTGGTLTGGLNVGSAIGSRGTAISVSGSSNSSAIALKSSDYATVFSILPHSTSWTYLGTGVYYQNGSWVHASADSNNALLGLNGSAGASWYASNNSTASWNVATNAPLWNSAGTWVGAINAAAGAQVNSSVILTSANYSSYALPLSGGTLTGNLTASGNGTGLYFTGGNNRIYFSGYRAMEGSTNGAQLQIGENYSGTYLQSANNYATTSNHLILHAGNYSSYALPLSGGTLTGAIYVGTTSSGSAARALRVGPSGGSPASFGSYSGSWRSTIEIWDNAATRMLHLTPPDGTNYNYSSIKSTDAGLRIDVGGSGGTNAIDISTSGVANFPQGLQQGGNQVLHAGNYSSYALPLSGGTMSGVIGRSTSVAGFFQGTYNNVGDNSARSNPIYTIGSSYNPADTTLSNMYGVGYAHPNASFISGPGFTGSWGMYVAADGNARVWLEASNGRVESVGDMRSPIFYDRNNTGYYSDPASTSRLNVINCGDVYNDLGGWFRNYGATGIYNQSYGNHFYSDSANYWNISMGGQSAGGLRFRDTHAGTIRGYVYADTSNNIGFLGSSGGWLARVVANDYFLIDGSSIRAPLYYDSNNTSYYFRPASTDTGYLRGRLTFGDYGAGIVGSYSSYRYQLVYAMGAAYQGALDGTSVSGGYGLWYSHPNAGGVASNLSTHGLMNIVNGSFHASLDASMRAVTDMRSPIYYDIGNTGYYVDAASTSYLYSLILSGAGYFRPQNWIQLDGIYGLYWPNHYGLHVRANDQSTYTQLCIQGSKNSYGGILDLYSSVNGMMYDSGGNGGVYREANGRWYFYHHVGNNCMGIGTSSTSSSYYMYVGGSIYSTGDVVAYSDGRKKTNIVTVDSALDKVAKLRGVYYNRIPESDPKIDPDRREIGVIAQEVNEVLPEVVTYAKDVDEYGVKYGNFAGLFIEAFKELQAEVKSLHAEVLELRGRLGE